MSNFVNQAEFARMQGWAKSYVTKLKQAGRLVFDTEGRIDVAASLDLIAKTDGGARPDVSARHAAGRGDEPADDGEAVGELPDGIPYKIVSESKKAHYQALQAEADYRRRMGELVEAQDVAAAVADTVITLRQSLENLPGRLASELVGKGLDDIRAALKQAIFDSLGEMERNFDRRLAELGEGND
ncbi:hypothetical protein [Chitinilyticum aquatile]|uniref:hypothetical protein n=1 Tax=Chitinilyticum aquatile TaxID=362520 RepID=UPI0003F4D1C9|nr:hypothetical protein [Chitinilyticum aquatile]